MSRRVVVRRAGAAEPAAKPLADPAEAEAGLDVLLRERAGEPAGKIA